MSSASFRQPEDAGLPPVPPPAPPPLRLAGGDSATGPLSARDLEQLRAGRRGIARIRRAAALATVGGWTLAFGAATTAVSIVLGDLVTFLAALVLAGVAVNEFRGAAALRRLDASGAGRLALGQVVLAIAAPAWAGWKLHAALSKPLLAAAGGTTGDANIDATIERLNVLMAWSIYGTLAVLGMLIPALTAWYYASRGRIVRDAVARTPAWVVDVLRITR